MGPGPGCLLYCVIHHLQGQKRRDFDQLPLVMQSEVSGISCSIRTGSPHAHVYVDLARLHSRDAPTSKMHRHGLGQGIFDGYPRTGPPDSPIPGRSSRLLLPSVGRNLEDNTDLACQGMLLSTTTSVLIFMSVGPVARLNFFEKKAGPIYEYLHFISYGCAQKCRPYCHFPVLITGMSTV